MKHHTPLDIIEWYLRNVLCPKCEVRPLSLRDDGCRRCPSCNVSFQRDERDQWRQLRPHHATRKAA